ncbi:MAG: PucR family transcriptional regulator [Actinomycetota bacterium]
MTVNTLARLVETLGRGVLGVACAPRGLDLEVHDVVVHDPLDPFDVTKGDLVVGVGLAPGPSTDTLVAELAAKSVAGLVLKSTSLADGTVLKAAEQGSLALLSVPAGASWSQIVQLVQSVLSHGTLADDELTGPLASDLFGLADAIADLIDAPVTIEDRGSRVLAYSGRQDEADAARAETIVGRHVPERFVSRLEEQGVFRSLRKSAGCVYIDKIADDVLPRIAVAVRAGDEMLGSIWAAVPSRPEPDKERAFAETAKVAALYLLRHRAGADVERTLQADLLASILQGTAGAREAATRLGLVGPGYRVMALSVPEATDGDAGRNPEQLRDVLAVHLSTFRVRGAAAVLGGLVFAVISCEADEVRSQEQTLRLAEDIVTRGGSGQFPGSLVAIGGFAEGLGEIPRSKREAEETLRVLRSRSDRAVASIEQVRLRALMARFAEDASEDRDIFEDTIAPLITSDRESGTSYLAALGAYFDSFGDYTAAAARLHIHPNTLRYRLRRAQEITGVKLSDPEDRLALMLLLRLGREGR